MHARQFWSEQRRIERVLLAVLGLRIPLLKQIIGLTQILFLLVESLEQELSAVDSAHPPKSTSATSGF